jgi:hypothetical protein
VANAWLMLVWFQPKGKPDWGGGFGFRGNLMDSSGRAIGRGVGPNQSIERGQTRLVVQLSTAYRSSR